MNNDPHYTVRAAHLRDLAVLPAIERAAAAQFRATPYPELATAGGASAHVDLSREFVWVVVDMTDQPVGFVIVRLHANAAHLHELDVHPRHARQGLGRRLLQAVAAWARARGLAALTLTTFADVPWNGPYYVRLGFRILDQAAWTPALQEIWHAEEAAGFPMAHRVCMQFDLSEEMLL
jgi:GNAT superfamily N-acetyltransferase